MIRFTTLGLVLGLLLAGHAGAQELAKNKAKALLKEGAAAEARDPAKALELYRQVADGVVKTSEQRAEALHRIMTLELQRTGGDFAAARAAGGQLVAEFPRDKRVPLVRPLIKVLDAWSGAQTAIAERDASLAAAQAAAAQAATEKEAVAAADKASSGQKVEELEARLRKMRTELDAAKVELAKKEEALQKLKKVVVGGG